MLAVYLDLGKANLFWYSLKTHFSDTNLDTLYHIFQQLLSNAGKITKISCNIKKINSKINDVSENNYLLMSTLK